MVRVQNKKIQWAIFLLSGMFYFFISTAQGQYGGGSGTAEDPFLIYTSDQMNAIGNNPNNWNRHFKLMANIDLSTLTGTSFNVIGNDYDNPFTGVFDGNEHTISHLTIRGKAFRALFGRLLAGAEVKDLGLIDVNVTGSMRYVAGLVGLNEGNVTNCYSTGIVNGKWAVGGLVAHNNGDITYSYSTCAVNGDEEVGGLVGYSGNGHIFCCYGSGTVNGYNIVGGLAGFNWLASVSQCYSTGVVNGGMNVGGLIGINYKGDLTDSYSTCTVIGSGFVGGLVGKNEDKIRNCYAIGSVAGIKNLGGLIGQNDTGGDVLFSFWDIETSGQTTSDGGMGKTSSEMQNIQTYWDAGWDFADEIENGTSEVWQIPEIGGYPLLAILSGHTSPQLQGFGTPEDPYIISDAFKLGAMIYHPHAHYRLTASIDLSGIRWGTAVIPWFRGTFDGNGHTISHLTIEGGSDLGLFGRLDSEAELKGLGVVDVNITGSGDYVGGLVGYNCNRVSNCYSIGEISGSFNVVGGLVGANWGRITTSYSNCTVTGNNYVGGLVGTSWGHITTSYSTGTVSGSSSVGGFIGNNKSNVNACFWDNQTSGLLNMCGSQDVESIGCDDSYGKTTVEMQIPNTFLEAGWDLVGEIENGTEDIWWIDEGQDYPRLWWERSTDDLFFLVVDDFESYNDLDPDDPASNRIWNTWLDGFDNPEINGSVVSSTGPMNVPWGRTFAHSGFQSMWYYYDNSVGKSEATMTMRYLRDWTIEGVGVLSLWFYGNASNAAERMYVTLANVNGLNAVVYHENSNVAQIDIWTEWRIYLQEFADQGLHLANVDSITLGFGDRNNPVVGGEGEMWFDDIRLYRPDLQKQTP